MAAALFCCPPESLILRGPATFSRQCSNGTRQQRARKAARAAGLSASVSPRGLMVCRPIGVSLAQNGISPQAHNLEAWWVVHVHCGLLRECDVEIGQR